MKNNHLNLTALSIIFGICFYDQTLAFCLGLFALTLLIWTVLADGFPTGTSKRILLGSAALAALSSMWYGNALSSIAVFISIVAFLTIRFPIKRGVYRLMRRATYLLSFGLGFLFEDIFSDKKESVAKKSSMRNIFRVVVISSLSLFIAIIFAYLYSMSNKKFDDIISQIDLSFLSIEWLFVCFLGFVLLYGFFFPRVLCQNDNNSPFKIKLGSFVSRRSIFLFGHILISVLSVMLFTFFIAELMYLFDGVGDLTPDTPGRYSEAVHDSVETLIFSCFLVICISLFIFRTRSIGTRPRSLEILTYVWLTLNLAVVITSAIKTSIYVSDLGLTYKRIGVYYFLLIVGAGLTYLIRKVRYKESNVSSYNSILRVIYASIIVSCVLPWNRIIAHYNFNLAIKNNDSSLIMYTFDLGSDSMVMCLQNWDKIKPIISDQNKETIRYFINYEINNTVASDIRSSSISDKINVEKLKDFKEKNSLFER